MEHLDPPGPALSAPGRFERVDRLLRQLATNQDQTTTEPISTRDLLTIAIGCAAIYGLAMGLFAATTRGSGGLAQMIASAIKVPLLFGMTIAVTFPSFYVICAVAGMETSAGRLLRMLLFGVAIASAILASLAPVVAFFTLSTDSHAFMVLLSVGFFAIATLLGLRTIRARAGLVFAADERRRPMGLGMLRLWMLTAIVVGAQSSWILRPLVGRPDDAFVWISPRESHALAGFFETIGQLLRGA